MIAFKIGVIALAGIIVIAIFKNQGSIYTGILQLCFIGLTIALALPNIKSLLEVFTNFNVGVELNMEAFKILFKSFFILLIGGFVGDICRDNGETALGGAAELTSKIIALSCAIPIFTAVIRVATSFVNR